MFARLSVRYTIGSEYEVFVIEYWIGFVAWSVDGVAEVDWACPTVSVPEGTPKVEST